MFIINIFKKLSVKPLVLKGSIYSCLRPLAK